MANQILLKRGNEAQRTFTPSNGEPVWVTDTKKLYIGDGSTVGGIEISDSGFPTITDDTTTNSDFYLAMSDVSTGNFDTATVTSTKLYFNPSTGLLNATEFNSLSDLRLKDNINTIEDTSVIDLLNPVKFNWKGSDKTVYGLIAQEVQEVLPELVYENMEGVLSLSYIQLIPLLIKEIQNLKKKLKPSNPKEVEDGIYYNHKNSTKSKTKSS